MAIRKAHNSNTLFHLTATTGHEIITRRIGLQMIRKSAGSPGRSYVDNSDESLPRPPAAATPPASQNSPDSPSPAPACRCAHPGSGEKLQSVSVLLSFKQLLMLIEKSIKKLYIV